MLLDNASQVHPSCYSTFSLTAILLCFHYIHQIIMKKIYTKRYTWLKFDMLLCVPFDWVLRKGLLSFHYHIKSNQITVTNWADFGVIFVGPSFAYLCVVLTLNLTHSATALLMPRLAQRYPAFKSMRQVIDIACSRAREVTIGLWEGPFSSGANYI